MKNLFLVGLISIIVIGGLISVLMAQQNQKSPAISPTPSPFTQHPSPSGPPQDIEKLRAGGSSYRDAQGVYVFLYPSDYVLDENDPQHIRIYKTGETQRGQTEMYDGVVIVFEIVALRGQTLEQWVDTRIKESTADGTVEITEPKRATTVNTYPGFTYTSRGLGEAKNLILQKNTSSPTAIIVTYSVSDPQSKNYQQEVNSILATIELLK